MSETKNARILVVEDEESIRFTFETFLRRAGYEVHTAEDYDKAFRAIDENPFDLVLADILLGGRTGIDVLRMIREKNQDCPVVMITGYPTVDTASSALRLGAFDYLSKPVEKETLLRVTRLALQHKATVEEKERYRSNLAAIFRSVKDGIIMVDGLLNVVEFNDAAEQICGIGRETVGKPFTVCPLGCLPKCVDLLRETVEKRETTEVIRHECRQNERERRVVSLTSAPVMDRAGLFSGAVLVAKDETHLVDLEEDLGERRRLHRIVGKSDEMQKIYWLIERLADVQSTVLITGETGTGKELVAEALHYTGARKDRALVKVNCSALSENLLESELFGHVRGAFTGALKDKMGRFQLAHGGTIFLDEIGDISPAIQQRLLRVLQEGEFERVGESRPTKVDVRIIAATNKNLREKVKNGEFREDLYYRLKVMEVHLPPLRNRREDIPMLTDYFIKTFNAKLGRGVTGVSTEVEALLMNHLWPGNVRELAHTIEHASVLCHQNVITSGHLPPEFVDDAGPDASLGEPESLPEDGALLEALEKTGWNKAKAARLLGVSRRTIYRKMEEQGLKEQVDVEEGPERAG